jgi:type II secretory pathway component PulF
MTALVRSAERTGSLAWALAELGELLVGRSVRLVRRISFVVSPLLVIGVGVLVGLIGLGMFMPLISLMTRLG